MDVTEQIGLGNCVVNKMYVAQITKNYKNIHIGSYKNLNEAIAARKKAEQALFGDYNYQEDQDFKNRVG